jgi:hypothetical protein
MTMTYATPQLKQACEADQNILNKLSIIKTDAPVYGTPGPGPVNLDKHAKHTHVYNQIGVAWVYGGSPVGSDQHILALGKKNDKAKPGNSGYAWDKKGNP